MNVPDRSANEALDLESFLELLPNLSRQELLGISATHGDLETEARDAARANATALARDQGLGDELDRLRGSIIQWASADIAQSSRFTMAWSSDPVLSDLRVQAVPALVDIATGLLLAEALAAADRELLLRPLRAAGD